MRRYSQPKAGTDDKQTLKDLDNNDKEMYLKINEMIYAMKKVYRGNVHNEWQ